MCDEKDYTLKLQVMVKNSYTVQNYVCLTNFGAQCYQGPMAKIIKISYQAITESATRLKWNITKNTYYLSKQSCKAKT